MKELVKYLGVILALVGVVFFIVYSQTMGAGNGLLITGMAFVVVGIIAHILLNKFIQ